MNIETVESQILAIPSGDIEHLADTIGKLKALKDRVRELDRLYQQALLEYIDEHGSVTVGDIRYYAGFETETINTDTLLTIDALFAHGDLEQIAGCLCSQPFKHGACKKILPPEVYNKLFQTIEKRKAKEGAPERRVLAANTRFCK